MKGCEGMKGCEEGVKGCEEGMKGCESRADAVLFICKMNRNI
jgi:hypothetical protein